VRLVAQYRREAKLRNLGERIIGRISCRRTEMTEADVVTLRRHTARIRQSRCAFDRCVNSFALSATPDSYNGSWPS
jgi:hypothetical protein